MSERETADAIAEAASDWAARLDRGLSQSEQGVLENWLKDDARRVGALARARALCLHAESALAQQTPGASASVVMPERPSLNRRWFLAGAAAAACLGGGVWLASTPRALTSRIGEVRQVSLEDGSSMTLGADTRVVPRFSPGRRLIELTSGEAFFNATFDAARPFVVRAGDVSIRTTAAAFALRVIAGAPVAVLLEHGEALVRDRRGVETRLTGGERLILSDADAPLVQILAPEAVQRDLAWRAGQLAFDNEPLASVAARFERYGPLRIVIDDPDLAREPVTGLFSASDPKGFAQAIAASLGARVWVEGDRVRLQRDAPIK